MRFHSVLFDLDGVLLDTESIYTLFWEDIDRRYPTGIDNFALKIKGTTLPNILSTYFPKEEIQNEIITLLSEHEKSMPYILFEGAIDLLEELHRIGTSVAVVTSSNRKKMVHVFDVLPELSRNVDLLITDEDVTASKPDPQGYRLAAERLNAIGKDYAVVEDSIAGLKAGRGAGAYVIGIATTNSRETIAPLADYVADTVADIKKLFAE